MKEPIGRRRWATAEGYVPGRSNGPEPQVTSHETACPLNTSDEDAHVEIKAFFSDREPPGPYRLRSRPGTRCTCGSTSWRTRSPSRPTPTTLASSGRIQP
jgi:hypothetical protein